MNSSQETTVLRTSFLTAWVLFTCRWWANWLAGKRTSELSSLLVCNERKKKVVGYSEKSNYPVTANMVHTAIAAVQVTAWHISGQTQSRSPSGNHLLEILSPALTKMCGLDDATRPSHGINDHFQVALLFYARPQHGLSFFFKAPIKHFK